MKLEYKNTIYEPVFEVTNKTYGLKEGDFWVNIKFQLKNDEIDYNGIIPGMSFEEIKNWNKANERFLNSSMKTNEKITFIRRFGELVYYPKKRKVLKKLYLFNDVKSYYSIYINEEEMKKIYLNNKLFIETVENQRLKNK